MELVYVTTFERVGGKYPFGSHRKKGTNVTYKSPETSRLVCDVTRITSQGGGDQTPAHQVHLVP